MALDRKDRLNLLIGSVLTTLVTLPTFVIVFGDLKHPSFLPANAWLWPTLWMLLLCGMSVAMLGLMRKVYWGYFLWSQMTLSFLILIIYIGRYRADRDYARFGADPDAAVQGLHEVSWIAILFLVLIWAVVGFLPLALRSLWRWIKSRRLHASQQGAEPSGND